MRIYLWIVVVLAIGVAIVISGAVYLAFFELRDAPHGVMDQS